MHAFILSGNDLKKINQKLQKLTQANLVDLKVLSPENNSIKIKQVRDLISWSHQPPINSPRKTAHLLSAHCLTIPAQNALLKTLEEPPEYLDLILITPNANLLLPTIRSRCQISYFTIPLQGLSLYPPTELKTDSPGVLACLTLPECSRYSHAQKILLAQQLGKNSSDALDRVEEWLSNSPLKYKEKLLFSRQQLIANCNPKLVLENLFLSTSPGY